MRSFVAILAAFVAAISASPVKEVVETKVTYETKKGADSPKYPAHQQSYGGGQLYHGQYQGKCGNDGFYYNNDASFVMCSNGNAYIQPCAPGSKNSAYNNYQHGSSYNYRDFCDINLVDDGYTLKYGYNDGGYKAPTAGYAPSTYGKPQPSYDGAYGYNDGYSGLAAGYPHTGYGQFEPSYNGGYRYNDGYDVPAASYRPSYGSYTQDAYADNAYGGSYQKTEYQTYQKEPAPRYAY